MRNIRTRKNIENSKREEVIDKPRNVLEKNAAYSTNDAG
jgi:hypothetical protein